MASNYDATEFVDTDFNPQKTAYNALVEGFGTASRAPTREEVDTRVLEAQKQQPFLVEVSAHHIHLTQEHVEALFGKSHQLTRHADLVRFEGDQAASDSQPAIGPGTSASGS